MIVIQHSDSSLPWALDGLVVNNLASRTAFGGKRFALMGAKIFNAEKAAALAPT